jgi:hypothetical protein
MQESRSNVHNLPKDIAERAFNMVKTFVNKTEKNKSRPEHAGVESGLGDQMKSAVVFDLSVRDFELALQKEPLDANILIWYGQCMYWNTRFVHDHQKKQKLEESADGLFERALKGKSVTQAKVYEAWAKALQEEALVRKGWQRTLFLQRALAQIQKCYQLEPDSREHYNASFIKWHSPLAEQQEQLDPSGRTFGTV